MINTDDQTVIIRIPVEKVKIRFGGAEKEVLNLSQGFCFAEFADGNAFPISNPLEMYLMDATSIDRGQRIYFQLEAAGPPSNDGQGNAPTDVTNIQTGL
jgi:hypothetical protein